MSEKVPTAKETGLKDAETILKIRTENRERKKRWREANEDRNKDNDLRCRVTKRANKIHGKEPSEEKTRWIEEEFEKRQNKRKEKERRRNPNATAGAASIGGVGTTTTALSSSSSLTGMRKSASSASSSSQKARLGSKRDMDMLSEDGSVGMTGDGLVAGLSPLTQQFDPNTVKTALALSEFVKKNGTTLDLASLTHVLTDPNLTQQLLEIERASAATVAAVTSVQALTGTAPPSTPTTTLATTASTDTTSLPLSTATSTSSTEPTAAAAALAAAVTLNPMAALHTLLLNPIRTTQTSPKLPTLMTQAPVVDTDYPMDAVLTLMQLNGSWKA
ncbi:hypothetical protein BGZ94_000840 [Podila epigama]|nr:hypothetical protein BGZ94_000840 [Podila epigama]